MHFLLKRWEKLCWGTITMQVCYLIRKNKWVVEKKQCWLQRINCIFVLRRRLNVGLCSVTMCSSAKRPKSPFPVWQCGSASDGLVTLGCITRDLASADGLSFIWKDASGSALTDVVQYRRVHLGEPCARQGFWLEREQEVHVRSQKWPRI